jgi:uncharacterized protein (TIGR03118 family)
MPSSRLLLVALFAAALVAAPASAAVDSFTVHDLVSDGSVPGTAADKSLVNAWGLSASATSPWWVSDNGTSLSTLYTGTGTKPALTVAVAGDPTGTVANASTGFVVSQAGKSGPARFLFATESGTILGWNPAVAATAAVVAVDRSSAAAVYKGLAIAGDRIYATDFHNGRVDVFDSSFNPVSLAGGFVDSRIKKGFAPFGIEAANNLIYVSYAKQDKAKHDDVPGRGAGYVDAFDANGVLVARIAKPTPRGPLDAPWGIAVAPASFGSFGGDLLVGNFGDGKISAYTQLPNGRWGYKGQLRDGSGALIAIDGLWGIAFGNGAAAGPTTTLYFTAGPSGEHAGLFGSITANG